MAGERIDHHVRHETDGIAAKSPEMGEAEDIESQRQLTYEPVKVQVVTAEPEQIVIYTIVLNSVNPVLPLIPRDPERSHAAVLSIDNPVVIAESALKAGNPNNQITGAPPAGGWLPVGTRFPLDTTAPVWAGITTATGNSRVLVVVTKR